MSRLYVEKWLKERDDIVKRKSSALDPARAHKATEEVRDGWSSNLDGWAKRMYERGQDPSNDGVPYWPWKTYQDIPAENRYNFDEEGMEVSKGRAKVLAASEDPLPGERRIFEVGTSDGKMPSTCSTA